MHLFHIFPLFAGLTAALTIKAPIHLQRRDPEAQDVQIAEIAFAGSGCPASNLPGRNVSDPTTLIVPRTIFTAESGKNQSQVVDSRTNCQTLIKVNHPSDWQFSVAKADYYGRVFLPQGVEAFSKTTYSFSGGSNEVPIVLSLQPYRPKC